MSGRRRRTYTTDDRFLRYLPRWISVKGKEMWWRLRYTTWGVLAGTWIPPFLALAWFTSGNFVRSAIYASLLSWPLTMRVMHEVDGDRRLAGMLTIWRNQALTATRRPLRPRGYRVTGSVRVR